MADVILQVEDNFLIKISFNEVNNANPNVHVSDGQQALDYLSCIGQIETDLDRLTHNDSS